MATLDLEYQAVERPADAYRAPDDGVPSWANLITSRRARYADVAMQFLATAEFFANGGRPTG